jgi:putative transposase
MEKVTSIRRRNKKKELRYAKKAEIASDIFVGEDDAPIDSQHLLISMLLPSAVKMFLQELESEVEHLCGSRSKQGAANLRWGKQNGSIVLGNQHVALEKTRVRDRAGKEVNLKTYEEFQDPKVFQQNVFAEGLKRVSQRDYQKGLPKIASSFGFSKSSVSRKWINATAKKLEEFQNRSLVEMDIRAVFIDGKRFKKQGVIIALGVGSSGSKFVLGSYQSSTEDSESCLNLLNDLEKRGLPERGVLFIVDGGSGLNKALNKKYDCDNKKTRRAVRVRCFVHKWRNIEKALGKLSHKAIGPFFAVRDAGSIKEARDLSDQLESILAAINVSALQSYLEAKEDLLVVHELRLSRSLKKFFSSTNPIESLNYLLEEDMRRVKKWQSKDFMRWIATFCLQNEKRMRKVRGFNALPALWIQIRELTTSAENIDLETKVG